MCARWPCLAGLLTGWSPEVPSNVSCSVILCHSVKHFTYNMSIDLCLWNSNTNSDLYLWSRTTVERDIDQSYDSVFYLCPRNIMLITLSFFLLPFSPLPLPPPPPFRGNYREKSFHWKWKKIKKIQIHTLKHLHYEWTFKSYFC